MKRLISFVIAGSTGFLVDAGTLQLLISLTPLGPFLARILSIAVAMSATWLINRTFTFGKSHRSVAEEGARYAFVGILGALINYGIYAGLLLVFPPLQPVAAVVLASLAGMGFSFFGYSRFVFRR